MCKGICKFPKLKEESVFSKLPKVRKSPIPMALLGIATVLFCVWFIYEQQKLDIEYHMENELKDVAIEISGIDFQSDDIELKLKSLSESMKNQCIYGSMDVVFGFQFNFEKDQIEDHIFYLCDPRMSFGNAKVIRESTEKVMCTEEFNGELVEKVRSKEVTIKAIDLDEWKQIQYTTQNAKESCIIQHAIDVLELKWV